MNKHFLVVGAGIAGTAVSEHLLQSGQRVTLLDRGNNTCSYVAAGIINPLGFRRMTKSWRADAFLNYALEFYMCIEQKTNSSFLRKLEMRRMFSSEQECQLWRDKQENAEFTSYLHPVTQSDTAFDGAKNPYGSGRLKQAYSVMAEGFFSGYKQWFTHQNNWLTEAFDYDAFNPYELKYKNISYDGVVFCQGADNPDNPFFNDIPVQTTKGELLIVQNDKLDPKMTLNRKCFVLPLEEGMFKIGATYEWRTRDCSITEAGKEKLLNAFNHLSDEPVVVLKQLAGIRPTSHDRRPYIGRNKEFAGIFMFNGLGSKGYLLAPLLAKEFVESILENNPLSEEVYPYRGVPKNQGK
jgi:glycine/D-amino acid oxidase-like deaminating enzyme